MALATMPRRTTSLAPLVQGAPAPPPAVNALFSVPRPDRTAQRPWTQTRKAQRSARTVGSVLPPSLEAGGSSIDAVSERVPGSVAQQAALVRAVGSMVSVASHLEAEVPWRRARALVDSGSQQPPLLSLPFAERLGIRPRGVAGWAGQADGSTIPIWSAGRVDMAVNGVVCPETFYIAPIAPYDIIVGESWLYRHRGILDYASDALCTADPAGGLCELRLDRPPVGAMVLPPTEEGTTPLSERLGDVPGFREAQAVYDWEAHTSSVCAAMYEPEPLPPVVGMPSGPTPALDRAANEHMPVLRNQLSARHRRHLQRLVPAQRVTKWLRRYANVFGLSSLPVARDMHRELPEDAELESVDVPGLLAEPAASFDFVEREVRQHLAHLPDHQVEDVLARLRVFESDVFETRVMPRLPPIRELDLDITERPGSRPVARRPYPVAPQHLSELDRQIQVLLEAGIIRRSVSAYGAPVLFAPKKDGKLRLCMDYRMLNLQTVRDKFPTPTAADLIARTRGARLLSKIDLHSGFHQLRIREEDIHKTAFVTPMGQYEFVTAPFGLSSTPSAFQRLMSFVLEEHIRGGYCAVYCDDIAVWSNSDCPLEHLDKLERVLASLREHQLLAKGSKCELFRTEMEFLGFLVGRDGVRPVPSKVEALQAVPTPETVSHVRSFLGMANFFRNHLPGFAEISAPLTHLLKGTKNGRQRVDWSVSCEESFTLLKDMLTSAPLLRHFDPTLRTAVHVDASQNAVGAVFLKWEPGEADPRPVCFLSRKLQGAQFHYDARNAEALAAQLALSEWRHYLYGVRFELHSDHASLASLMAQRQPSQRLMRLCEFLGEFDFEEIRYVRGADNVVPDFLSRPWGEGPPQSALHLLSHPWEPRKNSLQVSAAREVPEVVLWICSGNDALVAQFGRVCSLPFTEVQSDESEEQAAARLLRELGVQDGGMPCAQGRVGALSLYTVSPTSPSCSCTAPFQWRCLEDLRQRAAWQRTSFELLPLFCMGPPVLDVDTYLHVATSTAATDLLAQIHRHQPADATCREVLEELDNGDGDVWHDFFRNSEGVLCYQRAEDPGPRVCVPAPCRKLVLAAAHGGNVLVGHPGIARTAASVSRYYWWPDLFRDVAQFVRSCKACATSKASTHRRLGAPAFSAVPEAPFTHWAMDFIGPLSKSGRGHDWIVTWVDRTSKMIVAAPAKTGAMSGQDVAAMTFHHICCRFGVPLFLTHDNDVRFKTVWRDIWKRIGVTLKFTAAYNPQANPAERANRQVLEALRTSVETVTAFEDWDLALPEICFGLNNSVTSATGMSPFELAHGFAARTPLNIDIASTERPSTEDREAGDYALRVRNRLKAAADGVAAAGVKLGRLVSRRSTPASVKVGDFVWLDGGSKISQAAAKLSPRWYGPFRVDKVLGSGATVRLDFSPAPHLRAVSDIVNVRRLKFFEQRDAALCQGDEEVAPIVRADGTQLFEVDRIEGHRTYKGRSELLVRWKGYDTTWDTWVLETNLRDDVPGIVAKYWRKPSSFTARPSAPKRGNSAPAPPARAAPVRRNPRRGAPV